MMPVPGLDSVRCAWIDIRAQGFSLHGFLVFLGTDHFFPEYLDDNGLGELDLWSGNDCAIFVVQSPSVGWIEYTKLNGHPWWKLFGPALEGQLGVAEILAKHGNEAVIEIGGKPRTLRNLFDPCLNHFQHRDEIAKVLHRFNLKPTDHPALILFKEISDRKVWFIDLKDLVDIPQRDLRASLQQWFGGKDFNRLLGEARHA